MNIKSVITSPILPIDPKNKVEGNVRAHSSTDRDADGRREGKQEELKRHLTQQEFDDALKVLGEHPGLKANDLVIKVEVDGDHRVILILDPQGKIVRRLSESQLWSATRDKDRQTGRILDKAM
jgi:hypothetical protein